MLQVLIKKKSFIILSIGAFSLFASNYLLYYFLDSNQYNDYTIFITISSLIPSFGFLGFEQVLIRYSNVKSSVIDCNYFNKKILIFSLLFFTSICIMLSFFFIDDITTILLTNIILLLVAFSAYNYNIYRIIKNFETSQIYNSLWRVSLSVSLGLLVLINYFNLSFFKKINLNVYLLIVLLFLLITTIILRVKTKKITFNYTNNIKNKDLIRLSFQFSISSLSLLLINNIDKFFLKQYNPESLKTYFFLFNFFISPFALIQSYLGFKFMVEFKEFLTLQKLKNIFIKINKIGFGLVIFILITFISLTKVNIINLKYENLYLLILIFLSTSIIKINYTLVSSLNGAKSSLSTIIKSNIYSLITIILSVFLVISYKLFNPIEISLVILFNWLIRSIIYYYFTIKKITYDDYS